MLSMEGEGAVESGVGISAMPDYTRRLRDIGEARVIPPVPRGPTWCRRRHECLLTDSLRVRFEPAQ